MGRLRDLVTKVKEEVAPLASVVKEEVAQKVRNRSRERGDDDDRWRFGAADAPAKPENEGAKAEDAKGRGEDAGTAAAQTARPMEEKSDKSEEKASTQADVGDGSIDASKSSPAASPRPPADQIKINAQPSPTEPSACKFTVEIPIFEERLIRIKNRESADCSPLAQRLFRLPEVKSVVFSGNVITVHKEGTGPWMPLARQIGPIIREHIASGDPALTREPEPDASESMDNEALRIKVQDVIDTIINPGVAAHGGFVTLMGVDGDTAYIQMGGGCHGCGMADQTLKQGIAQTIQSQVPEIRHVLDSTDHAAGTNPYYEAQP